MILIRLSFKIKGMKQITKSILVAAVVFVTTGLLKAQAVFDISVKDINGQVTSISEVSTGELIVLDFWATWCKPCVKSIPKLNKLSEKYNPDQVSFVGINQDSPRNTNKVKPFVNSMGVKYPILLDPEQELMAELLVVSYPTLIVLNQKAEVLFFHEGYTTGDERLIEDEINKLLGYHE